MKTLMKNFVLVLLVFLVVSALFSLFEAPTDAEKISLNQLVNDINQEKVQKIVVSGEEIEVTYKDEGKAKTRKETESSLSQSLVNYGVNQESLSKIDVNVEEVSDIWVWLNPFLFSVLPLLVFGGLFWMILKKSKSGSMKAFSFTKNKAKLFESKDAKKTTFEDVAGLKEVKSELREVVDFLKNPEKYLKMGAEIPRGVLLVGGSGTGKTLMARAIAGEAGVPFFHTSGSSFVELFVGTGAARVRDLFEAAKKNTPCIVFIDEIDAVGRMRGTGIGGGHDEREQTLNQLLTEMDGFDRETNVIVMGATNRPDVLDKALLRPGRFDRRIVFDLPDIKDRKSILELYFVNKPGAKDVDLREVAERTPGFSGADLENVINEAAILAATKDNKKIYQEDLLSSIEKVMLGPEKRSKVISQEEKEIAAYHEAGHALVSHTILKSQPVRKISIISRGGAAGYVLKTPKEERRIRTKTEFLNSIAVALGGYCSEKLKYGEVTTGAANDLKKASKLAKKLVKVYGMSALGPITFGEQQDTVFLGKEITEEKDYSEKTAAKIDEEVRKFIEEAYQRAEDILSKEKDLLEKLAQTLMKKETIERKEFERIIDGKEEGEKDEKKDKKKKKKKDKKKTKKKKEEKGKKDKKKKAKKKEKGKNKGKNFKIKIKDL